MHLANLSSLEFRKSDLSPGKTEVKQGKFVEFVSPAKGHFRDTYKSQNVNPISPTPKFTLGIIQGSRVCLKTENAPVCCCNHDSILFDMQHDHVLIPLTPPPPPRVGGSVDIIFAIMLLD